MLDKIIVELTEKEHKVYLKFKDAEAKKANEVAIIKSEKKIADLETKLNNEKANLKALRRA